MAFELRYEPSRKQTLTRPGNPPRPHGGAIDAGAIGRNAGICVHLSIQFGDQQKRHACFQRLDATRAYAYGTPRIKAIPSGLGSLPETTSPELMVSSWRG
jgi:hypothetical protein